MERFVDVQPAKSASAYRCKDTLPNGSPTHPTIRWCLVVWMYDTSLCRRLSQSTVHLVMKHAKWLTARRRPNRAIRAASKIFIKTLAARG